MPLPKPKPNEAKEKWDERCMSSEAMLKEYPDEKQRYAICTSLWEKKSEEKDEKRPEMETRVFVAEELRVVREDGPTRIVGYAAVFNRASENLGGFVEVINPGAFHKALRKSDVRALWNHDPNYVLGRESAKTLRLTEDNSGLYMEVIPPDTQLIRDMVLAPIERGDVKEQSFGFLVAPNGDKWDESREGSKIPKRTILEVSKLFDVSPVTFPAYPDTKVALRSLEIWKKNEERKIASSDDGDFEQSVEPKQDAPIEERVEYERKYLERAKARRRLNHVNNS